VIRLLESSTCESFNFATTGETTVAVVYVSELVKPSAMLLSAITPSWSGGFLSNSNPSTVRNSFGVGHDL
jgi:hypothetical protein